MAGPNHFVQTRRATSEQSFDFTRAGRLYRLCETSDPLAEVRRLLPPEIKAVGFIGAADDCDISLWLPLGSRRVKHFLLSDPPEQFRQEHIEYVVVGGLNLQLCGTTLDAWRQKTGAELVASTSATLKVSEGPQAWHVRPVQVREKTV